MVYFVNVYFSLSGFKTIVIILICSRSFIFSCHVIFLFSLSLLHLRNILYPFIRFLTIISLRKIQNNIKENQARITCIMILNWLNILFRCTKHEMNASLVVKINISWCCTWFSASNTGIKMQPFPTSSATRNYSQYVNIDVVNTARCWNWIMLKSWQFRSIILHLI